MSEILAFVQKASSGAFLKLLFTKHQSISRIENYYRRIGIVVESFQVSRMTFADKLMKTDICHRFQRWSTLMNGK
jgi:hypothetical protein